MATTTKPASNTLSPRARTILASASAGISTFGVVLQLQDENTTGADDEIGGALQDVAEVFRKAGTTGQTIKRNDIVKAVADALYRRIGLEPVESE